MINGDPKEFVDGLNYGDERFFYFDNCKYLIQGYYADGKPMLELYILEPPDNDFVWRAISDKESYPVPEFESAELFNGKTF